MDFPTTLSIILLSFLTMNTAQHVEIPSDMMCPCQMEGYYQLPLETPETVDLRQKRQQQISLGYKIESLKKVCGDKIGVPLSKIPQDLLNEENPTPEVKCVMACILQRLQLMTKNNRISVKGIEKMANDIGNNNPLLTAIAIALAEQFNERLTMMRIHDTCEAGFRINQYIAQEMRKRKIDVPY